MAGYSPRHNGKTSKKKRILSGLTALFILILIGLLLYPKKEEETPCPVKTGISSPALLQEEAALPKEESVPENHESTVEEEITEVPIIDIETLSFSPHSVPGTQAEEHILSTEIAVGDQAVQKYESMRRISLSSPEFYSDLPGVFAFRGNNFRNTSSYGTADVNSKSMEVVWKQTVSSLTAPDGNTWTGTGWTGQPLIVTWPKETRAIMNLYDWAKEQEVLTEVIYAAEDGKIYFNELETGKQTRDIFNAGYTFKGSGSLDPRGYPVLYVGAGYDSMKGKARAFAFSLIDFSTIFEFGNNDNFAERTWPCFDASPLVDADTDTLIWPGENGVLYIIRLHSSYHESSGSLVMSPEFIKWKYRGERNTSQSFWLGMEDSPAIFQNYLYVADNGGYLMCLDLNTLELVWVQDVVDDTNTSPVLSLEDGHPYLYISTSFHYGWRSWNTAEVPVFKIDAETGAIVWKKEYSCYSASGVSGGVQGTIAVGEGNLSDYIFVPVSKAESLEGGLLLALRKDSGEEVWRVKTNYYSWGSPSIAYTENGDGYLFLGTLSGSFLMLDGKDGTQLDIIDLQGHCESTAAIYNNMLVIGARSGYIFGIKIQ